MALENHPLLVQAVYSFQGKNNDELCFKKGDIITVTQLEEGGWWEGTLATTDKTGWFPSNYVKDYKPQEALSLVKSNTSVQMPVDLLAQQKAYRNLVLRDVIDSEKANVAELQTLVKNFLHPLEKADILTREEYRQLVSNMDEVLAVQQFLLTALEECASRPPNEQRVGKVFLSSAPRMKQVHQSYCAAHPRAVCIIDKYKDELNVWMESAGASIPGILVLTTGLSKPFRRLDKYASMLQELERHVEENHPDRGDTQRSVSVYKEIASACSTTRRQKELELEVLTGGVRGWEGEDLQALGEIIHMGSVAVGPDHRDRYFVLFPTTLLMLSVSQRMSAFIYEGKLPLTGISANKLENTDNYKNAFEIVGPLIERIVAVCQTREDQQMWVDLLRQQIRSVLHKSSGPKSPVPPPHVSLCLLLPPSPYARLTKYFASLVHTGIITRPLLKKLLYRQFSKDYENVGVLGVKIRRNHRVECVIFPQPLGLSEWQKASVVHIPSDSGEEELEPGLFLERQDALDLSEGSIASTASSPFSLMCYVPPKVQTPLLKPDNKSYDFSNSKSTESSFETPAGHQAFPSNVCQDLSHLSEEEAPFQGESRHSLPPSFRSVPSHRATFQLVHTWHSASTILSTSKPLHRTHSSTLELAPSTLPLAEITFDPVIEPQKNEALTQPFCYKEKSHIPNCFVCGAKQPSSARKRGMKRRECKDASEHCTNELKEIVATDECDCCAGQLLSPRSSDSGLADITSPDITAVTPVQDSWLGLARCGKEDVCGFPSSSLPCASGVSECGCESVSEKSRWDPRSHRSRRVYRSGLYAHWGLKMRIPAPALQSLPQHWKGHHRNPPVAGKLFSSVGWQSPFPQ